MLMVLVLRVPHRTEDGMIKCL